MENLEKILKHNIFFTCQREDNDYRERGAARWSGIYKSNTKYDHKKLCFTDSYELLNQIKPFLYYLGSKDMDREGDGYIFNADLSVGLFWKDKNNNDDDYEYKHIKIWGVPIKNIGSELNFSTYFPYVVVYRELEKPFEIHIDVNYEYKNYLLIYGEDFEREFQYAYESESELLLELEDPVNTKCVICLSKKPQLLFVECKHYCVCLECEETKPLSKCPKCRKRIKTKVMI